MTCGSREERQVRVTAWWPEKLGVIPASGLMVTRAPEIGPACVRASTTLLNGSEEHRPTRWTSARGNDQAMGQLPIEARSAHGSSPYQRAALSAPPELAEYAEIRGKRSLARTPAPDAVAIASHRYRSRCDSPTCQPTATGCSSARTHPTRSRSASSDASGPERPVWAQIDAADFEAFTEPGFGKIACNFSLRPYGADRTLVSYECRTLATDETARRGFMRYWRPLAPFIGLVMRSQLRVIEAETTDR